MGFSEDLSQIIGAVVTLLLILAVAIHFALEYRANRLKWREERRRKREEEKNKITNQLLQHQEEIGQKILQALSELAEEKNRLTDQKTGYTIKVRREMVVPDVFVIRVGWGMQKEKGEIIFDEVITIQINLRDIPQIVMVYGFPEQKCKAELGATEEELAFVIKNIGEHMQDFTPSPCKM